MTWTDSVTNAVRTRFRRRWWALHDRGLVATARTSYRTRPLPDTFEMRWVGPRRVAFHPGRGRPLLILPGLYASLDEGLFSDLAARAARLGRPVALLEDRFAAETLRRNGGEVAPASQVVEEAGAVARSLGEPPDVLALSAGVLAALCLPTDSVAQVVGWSGTLSPAAVAASIDRNPVLGHYYRRVHERAFARAGVRAPDVHEVRAALSEPMPIRIHGALLFHAVCDPVSPAESVRGVPDQTVALLPCGGHLGFGPVGGDDVYLAAWNSAI